MKHKQLYRQISVQNQIILKYPLPMQYSTTVVLETYYFKKKT